MARASLSAATGPLPSLGGASNGDRPGRSDLLRLTSPGDPAPSPRAPGRSEERGSGLRGAQGGGGMGHRGLGRPAPLDEGLAPGPDGRIMRPSWRRPLPGPASRHRNALPAGQLRCRRHFHPGPSPLGVITTASVSGTFAPAAVLDTTRHFWRRCAKCRRLVHLRQSPELRSPARAAATIQEQPLSRAGRGRTRRLDPDARGTHQTLGGTPCVERQL